MAIPFTLQDLIFGGALPCAVAAVICAVGWRARATDAARTIVASSAIAIGFLIGVRLLDLSDWKPGSHWHWLPYLGCLVAMVHMASIRSRPLLRLCAAIALLAVCAWLLTPTWKSLPLSSVWLIAIFGVSMLLVWLPLRLLFSRSDQRTLSIILAGASLGAAMVLMLAGSLRFGLLGGCIAAAFTGLAIVLQFDRRDRPMPDVALTFVVLVGGALFVGRLNSFSNVSLISYVLPVLAPLTLWLQQLKPMSAWTKQKRAIASVSLAALPVLVAIGLAISAAA